jgi:hypothetical protein
LTEGKMKAMARSILLIFSLMTALTTGPVWAAAEATSEHIEWSGWSFNWEVRANTGLALRDVTFEGEKLLAKASMPVVRVKYVKEMVWWNPFTWFGSRAESGRCGPFQDRLRWRDLVPILNCGNQKVCIETSTQDGIKWLELGVYARIGEYHIYQAWHLSGDGELRPVLHSRGLSCNTDHAHHPYWRFDFDINGNGMDQAFVHDDGVPDGGWGRGWRKYTNELNDIKSSSTKRVWFIRDQPTGHGAWVLPGTGYSPLKSDGDHDAFSPYDIAVRRASAREDVPWVFGARGQLGYGEDNQGVQEQDIVLWYISHLPHGAALGPGKWLTIGPVIRVQR